MPGARLPATATGTAQQLHSRIRAAITEITQRLWGDLPAEDLATAGRVLAIHGVGCRRDCRPDLIATGIG